MKFILALLFTGKLGMVMKTGGTMLLSIFVYGFAFGWRYAVGIVLLIFVHEMGHFLAAKRCGLNVGAPTFIPFVGAWIELKEQPMNAETEAYVGIAGPLLGSVAAFAVYLVARNFSSPILLALSYSGFMLNLFNLIPMTPLDGGRIVAVISPKIWFLGIPLLAAVFFWRPSPLLVLIALMAIPQMWSALKNAPSNPHYYQTSTAVRVKYAAQYLTLVFLLAVMAFEIHEELGR